MPPARETAPRHWGLAARVLSENPRGCSRLASVSLRRARAGGSLGIQCRGTFHYRLVDRRPKVAPPGVLPSTAFAVLRLFVLVFSTATTCLTPKFLPSPVRFRGANRAGRHV